MAHLAPTTHTHEFVKTSSFQGFFECATEEPGLWMVVIVQQDTINIKIQNTIHKVCSSLPTTFPRSQKSPALHSPASHKIRDV